MPKIILNDIYKEYPNGYMATKGIDLEIETGEFLVLVGPSGCGKSTILRMIAGLEDISGGELVIGDRVVNDLPPKDRDIAMVFQNYALYPHMSVYDNMALGLKIQKIKPSEIKARIESVVDILDLRDYLKEKPRTLSGGQRQRVALGRAMVRNPAVFLLDEPLSNLDAKLRAKMRTELIKLHQRLSTTFIYVTHDQVEAMTMGTRIVVLRDGRIEQVDTPQNLFDFPKTKFVAGFIGTPEMNFIQATVRKGYLEVGDVFIPYEKPNLEKYMDQAVWLGIRPEHIHRSDHGAFLVNVEVSELLGSESLIYFDLAGMSFVLKSENEVIKSGESIRVDFDPNKIHLFDLKNELRIE